MSLGSGATGSRFVGGSTSSSRGPVQPACGRRRLIDPLYTTVTKVVYSSGATLYAPTSCICGTGDDLNVMPVSVQLQVDITLYGSAEQESQFENEGARDADGSYVSHGVSDCAHPGGYLFDAT